MLEDVAKVQAALEGAIASNEEQGGDDGGGGGDGGGEGDGGGGGDGDNGGMALALA